MQLKDIQEKVGELQARRRSSCEGAKGEVEEARQELEETKGKLEELQGEIAAAKQELQGVQAELRIETANTKTLEEKCACVAK